MGSQLASFPADLRIESWLHHRYPGLRRAQEKSIVADVRRAFPLLTPALRRLTPPSVYFPTMAMNAAQAWQVSLLYRRPDLVQPFQTAGFADKGKQLMEMVLDVPDEGHRSDMKAVDDWARELSLTHWFEWAPYADSR